MVWPRAATTLINSVRYSTVGSPASVSPRPPGVVPSPPSPFHPATGGCWLCAPCGCRCCEHCRDVQRTSCRCRVMAAPWAEWRVRGGSPVRLLRSCPPCCASPKGVSATSGGRWLPAAIPSRLQSSAGHALAGGLPGCAGGCRPVSLRTGRPVSTMTDPGLYLGVVLAFIMPCWRAAG